MGSLKFPPVPGPPLPASLFLGMGFEVPACGSSAGTAQRALQSGPRPASTLPPLSLQDPNSGPVTSNYGAQRSQGGLMLRSPLADNSAQILI